jgi:hypothetical protein
MVFKRKSSYRKKPMKRAPQRRKTTKKSFVTRVKKVITRTCETKRRPISWNKVEIFHNVFSSTQILHLNGAGVMPTQGVSQVQRNGDVINTTGYKMHLLIGQKGDHPNVNFRWFCVQVPKGQGITYGDLFHHITANVMLDEIITYHCKVIDQGWFHPNMAGIGGTGGDEFTFTKRFWIPHKRTYKFGPTDDSINHNQHDLYFSILCYDVYGSVVTDNIVHYQCFTELQYSSEPMKFRRRLRRNRECRRRFNNNYSRSTREWTVGHVMGTIVTGTDR